MMMRHGPAPAVVHIGYHKTASTWLQVAVFPKLAGLRYRDALLRELAVHLAMADDEGFFAAGVGRLLDAIARRAGPVLLSNEGLSGSLWDGDTRGLRNAERIHQVLPGARIVVLVRRQDEMLRSIHAQYVNEGGTCSLRAFLTAGNVAGSRFALRHLEYDRLVERYVDLFGERRVWVAPYEQLRAQPDEFLEALCAFAGTRLAAPVSRTRENRSLSTPALALLRAWNRVFRRSPFNPRPLVALPGGGHVRALLEQHLDSWLRRLERDRSGRGDAALLRLLAERFGESNARLQRFCREPLAEWGYHLAACERVRPDCAALEFPRAAAAVP